MSNWWELTEEEIVEDADAIVARALVYFNTLYSSDDGRRFLVDLGRLCYAEGNTPVETVALIRLFHTIKARAGLAEDGEMAAIEAEAKSISL